MWYNALRKSDGIFRTLHKPLTSIRQTYYEYDKRKYNKT